MRAFTVISISASVLLGGLTGCVSNPSPKLNEEQRVTRERSAIQTRPRFDAELARDPLLRHFVQAEVDAAKNVLPDRSSVIPWDGITINLMLSSNVNRVIGGKALAGVQLLSSAFGPSDKTIAYREIARPQLGYYRVRPAVSSPDPVTDDQGIEQGFRSLLSWIDSWPIACVPPDGRIVMGEEVGRYTPGQRHTRHLYCALPDGAVDARSFDLPITISSELYELEDSAQKGKSFRFFVDRLTFGGFNMRGLLDRYGNLRAALKIPTAMQNMARSVYTALPVPPSGFATVYTEWEAGRWDVIVGADAQMQKRFQPPMR